MAESSAAAMEPSLSQDSLASLLPPTETSLPVTPDPPHATLPAGTTAAVSKAQSSLIDASNHMTPPPSTQLPSSQRVKSRTPTPTASHISTPPPTVELPSQTQYGRSLRASTGIMPAESLASATLDELRSKVMDLQAALQEAKMTAAHHKLQYQMLSQESAAAIERMSVEARMAQQENDIIQEVNQARVAATPTQASPFQDGMIPVQKDLYQRMCREIRDLTEERNCLVEEHVQKDRQLIRQDSEMARLEDKVMLMRERIRENRHHIARQRRSLHAPYISSTPRTLYPGSGVSSQEQPFAALLQASEMASQEARHPMPSKKGHIRNTHSMSSLPTTPHRSLKQTHTTFQTPHSRQTPLKIPSTAPVPRTSAIRTPDIYSHPSLPLSLGPASDGTVSASEADDDDDSEAETDILSPSARDTISESQASLTASQMLRPEPSQPRNGSASFQGRGMLEGVARSGLKQTKLFGAVRKRGAERDVEERGGKRARVGEREGEVVGLGIAGVRS